MKTLANLSGVVFGIIMLALSFAITAETLLRKFFHFSLGGIDELGGYAVAIASPLAFTVALVQGGHIRITQLSAKMPLAAQAVLDGVSTIAMGALAIYFLYFSIDTVADTNTYKSIAQTPWATPLIYPQSVWLVAMAVFAVAALVLSARSALLLARRDWAALRREFGGASAQEELDAELEDLRNREAASQ